MKYILNNPTEEQINALKKLGLCVYCTPEGIHYVDVPEIQEEELPKVDVVDLDLPSGLKWASCNIGANSPCESGLLFQFGRVDGYAYGDTSNQFRTPEQNTVDTGNSYIPATTSGKIYSKGEILDKEDDAAYVTTKGKIRMPTVDEIKELVSYTNNEWCQCTVLGDEHTNHSVFGRLFTSKTDGSKKIFIPAAGFLDGDNGFFHDARSFGYVWSSSVYSNNNNAFSLSFASSYCLSHNNQRYNGFTVRGVCDAPVVDLPEITEEELTKGVVDLGLPSGVKWASCNIGANSPCESGLLFQFGRVDGYAYGDTSNQFRTPEQNKADTGDEYIPATTSGKIYSKGEILYKEDDAAYVATNGKLRMPTVDEIKELISYTNNEWCQCTVLGNDHTSHNVYGRLFTSKKNTSKKIFIPAAGNFNGEYGSFSSTGSHGYVWSSSVDSANLAAGLTQPGSYLDFNNNNCFWGSNDRYNGFSVRGVCK